MRRRSLRPIDGAERCRNPEGGILLAKSLSYPQLKDFLLNFTRRILRSKDELNRMDAACGDGDFGTTMYVAFNEVLKILESSRSEDAGSLFSEVGQRYSPQQAERRPNIRYLTRVGRNCCQIQKRARCIGVSVDV